MMWQIEVFGDRTPTAEKLHSERFEGTEDQAAKRAAKLTDVHGGLLANVDPA